MKKIIYAIKKMDLTTLSVYVCGVMAIIAYLFCNFIYG